MHAFWPGAEQLFWRNSCWEPFETQVSFLMQKSQCVTVASAASAIQLWFDLIRLIGSLPPPWQQCASPILRHHSFFWYVLVSKEVLQQLDVHSIRGGYIPPAASFSKDEQVLLFYTRPGISERRGLEVSWAKDEPAHCSTTKVEDFESCKKNPTLCL